MRLAKRYADLADAIEELSLHLRAADRGRLARDHQLAASALRQAEHLPPDPSEMDEVSVRVRDSVAEWRAYGEIDKLTELREKRPYLSSLCQIAKVGPSTAENMYEEFGVTTIDEVRELDEEGKLEDVTGVGPKTATTIRRSIAQIK
jgi:DNA polymerase/3'-5' exonuclease PolX